MKKTSLIFSLSAICLFLFASCDKNVVDGPDPVVEETCGIRLNIESPAPLTKAGDTDYLEGEVNLNKIDVFVFRVTSGADNGMLDSYKSAETSEINNTAHSAQIVMTSSTGSKNIYVVANAPESLVAGVTTESELKSMISEFSDNNRTNFVMVGTPGTTKTLVAGTGAANSIDISLRRLVGRIKLEQITAAFTSSAVRNSEFTVKRIYLGYVPKQVKYVNGDVSDAFGTAANKTVSYTFNKSETNYTINNYYTYAAPSTTASASNGSYTPLVLTSGTVNVESNANVSSLTKVDLQAGSSKLYTTTGTATNPLVRNDYFYFYPNNTAQATMSQLEAGTSDLTTKIVVETEWKGVTYYYPISLGYTQPNYAYTINNLTLTRLGSTDPNVPVTIAQCTFTVTVANWLTGQIIGHFDGTDANNIVI